MSDVPQVLLAHHLKALKLPTLREHDKPARQCAAKAGDAWTKAASLCWPACCAEPKHASSIGAPHP